MGLGGLELRSIVEINMAPHGKWIWRYLKGNDRLWKRVMEAHWGKLEDSDSWDATGRSHGLSLWRKSSLGSGKFLQCVE